MKKLLTILFLLSTFSIFAQVKERVIVNEVLFETLIEADAKSKELFCAINSYRKSKGLDALEWSTELYNASLHHSKYLCVISNTRLGATHREDNINDKIEALSTPDDRGFKYIGGYSSFDILLENVAYELRSNSTIDHTFYIDLWKKSPGHNKVLLDNDISLGACSIVSVDIKTNFGMMTVVYVTFMGIEFIL